MEKSVLLFIILVISSFVFGCKKDDEGEKLKFSVDEYHRRFENKTLPYAKKLEVELKDGRIAQVMVYPSESEDFKHAPDDPTAKIVVDGAEIHKNRLEVMLKRETTEKQLFELIAPYKGEVIGFSKFYKSYIVKFKTETFEELKKILDDLEANPLIRSVAYQSFSMGNGSTTMNNSQYAPCSSQLFVNPLPHVLVGEASTIEI